MEVSDEGARPRMNVAIYHGFPTPGTLTGFTMGLSHFHPPGGTHAELTISMSDSDDAWALACGFSAFQLREHFRFGCGSTIDFADQIARSSRMSAFVVVHPLHINSRDCLVDIGVRRIEIFQLMPIYEEERAWLNAGGNLKRFLQAFPDAATMNPQRKPFEAR